VSVEVTHTRTYDVPARDANDALARYQRATANGTGDFEETWGDNQDSDELAHTAQVDGHPWPGPAHGVETDELATLRAEVAQWRAQYGDLDLTPTAPPTYTPTDDEDAGMQHTLESLRGTDQEPYPRIENCVECGKLFEPDRHGDDTCADC
jgi:hypothetical protein